LNFRELFEIFRERAGDGIERAIRLATARKIDVRNAISKYKFAIAGEAIEHEGESLIAFDIAGTFEEFIQDAADQVL
jgi:hypothetical protein